MKNLLLAAFLLCSLMIEGRAATVIFMDEGINTKRPWKAKNFTDPTQICRSLITDTVLSRIINSIENPEFLDDFHFRSLSLRSISH